MNALTYIGSSDGFRLTVTGILVPAVAWLLAWSVTRIIRRASAATRHLVWLLSFVAMAAWVPCALSHFEIGVPILPPKPSPPVVPVQLPVFPWEEKPEPMTAVSLPHFSISMPKPLPKFTAAGAGGHSVSASRAPEVEQGTGSWTTLLLAAWAMGFLLLSGKMLAGVLHLRRVTRTSRIADEEALASLCSELCARIGLPKSPDLLISASVVVPLVSGLWPPRVILPETVRHWPKSMLRTALIHELAHVRRNDLISSAIARLVVAIYWFNPFAWIGLRALQAEAEMAADDCVVTLESQPISYAESLVALVRDLRKGAGSLFPAIGMLRRAGIEARVERILNPSCRRAAPRRQIRWAACCIAALLAVGFAVLHPVAAVPVPVRPINGSTAFEPFTPQPFSMDLGYTDVVQIKDHTYDIIHYLPAGNGPRYGPKIEPLLSPVKTTSFDMAVKPKFAGSVVNEMRIPFHMEGNHSWNVDSPGPGYREQRAMPVKSEGFSSAAPQMNGAFN